MDSYPAQSMPHGQPSPRRSPLAALLVAVAAALGGPACAEKVAQVSLLIGAAEVVHADGSRTALARGAPIRVGDRVETGANGHVHLRFVDDGAVSVRPDSILEVQAYRYDAASPQRNEVRLKLVRGTGRSLSGAATEVDKARFRLNTPIAAIGVRGTDFVVQAAPSAVRATVADGAIVVAPYGEGCSAGGLGPCEGVDARELSAGMGRIMAVVRPGDQGARLVRASDLAIIQTAFVDDRDAGARERDEQALSGARASGMLAAEPTAAQQQRGNDRAAAEMLTLAAVNVPDLNRPTSLSSQLVWGRWAILPGFNDELTMPFALARLGRHVTVADQDTGLFRSDPKVAGELFQPTASGQVEFRLTRASASYESAGGLEVATVRAGNLTVDFDRRSFATALDLRAMSGAEGRLRMAGDLRSDGLFAVIDENQRVAGALSTDGKEAGYLFVTGSAGSLFSGRTLWGTGP
ncbi:MAG: FecR domain-containing protein [Burkholderiales bacterium]|nr:FecR domain-containing protein [Burkholderiales bacterium]